MAIGKVSYDSSDLIEELEQDIAEFGSDEIVAVWLRRFPKFGNIEFAVNYDFIAEEKPIKRSEVDEDERLVLMGMGELMELLKKQDSIF